jgi:glutamine synthetase
MTPHDGSLGRSNFVDRHVLWTHDDREAGRRAIALMEENHIEVLRLSFADQHGLLRGKALMADEAESIMESGCSMTSSLLAKDTAHRTVYPIWQAGGGFGMDAMTGAGDFIMVPDPRTFRILPWLPSTAWMQCDIYFADGTPVPFCTRRLCRSMLAGLRDQGYDIKAGLEVEFHLFRLVDAKLDPEHATQPAAPPEVALLSHGFQYLTEARADEMEPAVEKIRQGVRALDLPLRSVEVEFGPSQCEFTFHPQGGLEAADAMVLFRSAVKQIARREGLHATFMCRPAIPNIFSSGWHMHQSLVSRDTGANAFVPQADEDAVLSRIGLNWVAGLIGHARAASVFTTPTINGYKRYRPFTLAPDRAVWGLDNKGTMVRALGGPGDPGTRIENRIGEPAANPYLYMAAQIACGLDGIAHDRDPGPPADAPYETEAEPLPASLLEAVDALDESAMFRDHFGDRFIDYITHIKRAEISRFLSEVTDWEQREYFENF